MDNDPYFLSLKWRITTWQLALWKFHRPKSSNDFALLEEYWYRDILIEVLHYFHPYLVEQWHLRALFKSRKYATLFLVTSRNGLIFILLYEVKDGKHGPTSHMILIPEMLVSIPICGQLTLSALSKPLVCKNSDWNPSRSFFLSNFLFFWRVWSISNKYNHK